MLEREHEYFENHKDELLDQYRGQYLVIVDETVQGAFKEQADAYDYAFDNFERGKFLVRLCVPDSDAMTYHSRIIMEA